MRAYSVFDDFPEEAVACLKRENVKVTLHPRGEKRPDQSELKKILEEYDILIIGTGQLLPEESFKDIKSPRLIATASIGTDHIRVPKEKSDLVRIINAPAANRKSVAEHIFGLILALKKQFIEGRRVAALGENKKSMKAKPTDLYGSTIGVVGAGGTAGAVLTMAMAFGMQCLCWTRSPDRHSDLREMGVQFVTLEELLKESDIVSVNIPLTNDTKGLISEERVAALRDDAVFISVSRAEVVDQNALFLKAGKHREFSVGLDLDADQVSDLWNISMENVIVTPHIAGGTKEARIRMFHEVCDAIIKSL